MEYKKCYYVLVLKTMNSTAKFIEFIFSHFLVYIVVCWGCGVGYRHMGSGGQTVFRRPDKTNRQHRRLEHAWYSPNSRIHLYRRRSCNLYYRFSWLLRGCERVAPSSGYGKTQLTRFSFFRTSQEFLKASKLED